LSQGLLKLQRVHKKQILLDNFPEVKKQVVTRIGAAEVLRTPCPYGKKVMLLSFLKVPKKNGFLPERVKMKLAINSRKALGGNPRDGGKNSPQPIEIAL